jgi:hypothetical protein
MVTGISEFEPVMTSDFDSRKWFCDKKFNFFLRSLFDFLKTDREN